MVYDGDLNTVGSFSVLAESPVALVSSRLLLHTFFNDLTLSMGKLRLCSLVLGILVIRTVVEIIPDWSLCCKAEGFMLFTLLFMIYG